MNNKELLPDKSLLPILNLDVELYERNNVSIAYLVIISGLIKNVEQRREIFERVKPDDINVPFNRYLYEVVTDELRRYNEINIASLINRVPDFGPKVYGSPTDEFFLRGNYYTLAQILDFQPTPVQVSKAIDIIVEYANRRSLVD